MINILQHFFLFAPSTIKIKLFTNIVYFFKLKFCLSLKRYTWIFHYLYDSIAEKLIHKPDTIITKFNPMEISSFLRLQGKRIHFKMLEEKIKKYSLPNYGEL